MGDYSILLNFFKQTEVPYEKLKEFSKALFDFDQDNFSAFGTEDDEDKKHNFSFKGGLASELPRALRDGTGVWVGEYLLTEGETGQILSMVDRKIEDKEKPARDAFRRKLDEQHRSNRVMGGGGRRKKSKRRKSKVRKSKKRRSKKRRSKRRS